MSTIVQTNLFLKDNAHFKIMRVIYFILLIGELIGLYLENHTVEFIFKPLVMLVLITYYTLFVQKIDYWFLCTLLVVLVFDIVNILNYKENFLLIGAVIAPFIDFYYIYYLSKKNKKQTNLILVVGLIFMFIGGFLFYFLSYNFTNIITPILFKYISLLVLCNISFVNYLRSNKTRNLLLFISFILLLLADICYGIYTYYKHTIYLNICVVFFYSISHYLSFVQITAEKQFLKKLH